MAERGPRPLRLALEALSAAVLLVAVLGATLGSTVPPRPLSGPSGPPGPPGPPAPPQAADAVRPADPQSDAAPADDAGSATANTHAPLEPSTPLWVAIPSIGLRAPLLALGMDGQGRPELPPFSTPATAGWLRDTPSPGALGAAVLVGHVDTTTGPAVFWSLSAVRRGADVRVGRIDGSTAEFTVDEVRVFPRAQFPAGLVYGPTRAAELRIVTCGGAFDRAAGEYTGNVVLFAHLTGAS